MDDKPECFDVEPDSVIWWTEGVNVCDGRWIIWSIILATSIAETPDGEIKEFKIEIQQKGVSLNHETRKHWFISFVKRNHWEAAIK